jgi:hypothetical protein
VTLVLPFVQAGADSVPARVRQTALAGPGDDDDETPIGDPPDDEGDDWDDEDEDEDEDEDDEDPLQAAGILRRSIATSEASRHNGVRLTGR